MNDNEIRAQCCCFTGHREIPPAERETLKKRLWGTLETLIGQGVCYFAAGGARGFDTLAAQTVLELKVHHPHIRLILVLPCKDQTHGWHVADVAAYQEVLRQADKTVWITQQYYPGCMHERNRRLVDNAAVCVCYYKHAVGGTAYTVGYARKNQRRIINVAS